MAASAASEGSSPGLCPSYAVICSFLERYGALLDLPELTFPQLERYLQDTSSVPKLLVDLHVKLLRKIGKSVSADRWEKYLVKVCHEFNSTWAWELENKGYKDMSVECKTGILKHLCECQFDDNVKFKTAINEEDPEKMRLQPIGKDRDGLMYWFQLDQDNNVRVYVEEQDDLDGSSWKCIVRDRNSLAEILELLKTQIDPALLTKKGEEDEKTREGSVLDKPLKDTASLISPKREITEKNSQKEELELDVSDAKFPSNGLKDNQVEATSQSEEPMVDDKVTINPQAIKEEPMDVSESKPLAEKPHVTPPIEQIEEAKRKTAEELQRAMKNDQQAKIPLKKREMKLSDDFDNNGGSGSSIIVRTPSVATVKETPKVEQTNKLVSVDLEGTVKETQSDQVNGDLQPVIERSINNGLRESSNQIRTQRECAYGKGQLKKDVAVGNIVAGEASAKEKTSFSMEKDNEEREMASNTMETMDGPIPDKSNQTNMVTATVTTKEIAEVSEKIKESSLKKSVPPLMTEPLTSSQDATIPPEMSDRKREKIVKTSKWDMKVRCTEVKTSTSIQTQNVSSSKSEKPEETKGMDSSFGSQPVTYKEISQTFLDICPLSVVKEKQTTEATEKWLDPKNLKTSVISKQTERPDPITEKPDCSKCTEMPAVIKNTEKTFSNKECAEKCDGSQDIGTFSVIKKTEISEKSKYENLVSPNETNTASVIKKADKPVPNKGDHLDSIKETVKSTVIKMTVKSEVSTHADVRCDGPTDIEMLAVTLEKSSSAASTDRKAAVETKSGLKNEMADISMKSTHLQLDEPKKGTKSATPEDAGKLSTAKIAGKSPGPEVAGKSPGPEVAGKSPGPEVAGKSPGPEVAGKSPGPEVAGKSPSPEVAGKSPSPEVAGKSPSPEVAGKSPSPEVAGKSPSPEVAGKSPSPEVAGKSPSPEVAGKSPSPDVAGKSPSPDVAGKSPSPDVAGKSPSPDVAGKSPSPDVAGKSPSPDVAGKSPSPDVAGKSPSPDVAGKSPSPDVAGKSPSPDVAGKSPSPDVAGKSPSPDVAGKSPSPDVAGKSPSPDVAGKSPSPDVAGKSPSPDVAGKSPSPDVAGKSPSPEAVARSASPEEAASSLKESVPMEEPMEIHLEKSMDDSDFKKYTDDGCPKKAVIGGEKSEIKPNKDLISLNCDAPSGNQATRKKASFLTEILSDEDKIHDRVMKEDVPQKDVQEDDQAKKKGDDKTKTDDKKEEEGGEKDDRTSAASGVKVSEGSEEDEPKTKKDEDKSEKQDAVTTSEIQEEGIRLKIRGITHRRKAELQREERDSGSDTGETGRSLRRSPRICRPTPKGVEFQDRRMEKKQTTPTVEKVDEENKEEEEQDKTIQRKPREKVDGQSKSKGRRRRKTRWSNTRTRRRKKNGSGEDEESESSEEESEEDDSDESFKVEGGKRRRRNRNRERHSDDSDTSSDDDLPPNDDPCKHCGLPNHPELILLCDSCDNGYHTACLRPPLMIIPDGEWFCPPCQHKLLCDKLEEQLTNLDAALKKRERAERRKERLVYVGISVENIITPSLEVEDEKQAEVVKKEKKEKKERIKSWGRRSTRTKKSISYRYNICAKHMVIWGAGRGKDMANITGHSRGKDMSTILAAGEGGEGKENGLLPPRPSAGQRRKKRRRLNDLDSDSTMEEEESEDEFRLSDSTEEEEFVASDKSGAESEVAVDSNDDSDFGSIRRRTARTRRPAKRQRCTRPRKRRKPEGYSDDEEEETSEEDEDEIVSEGSSEFSDSDLDCSRRRSRRSQTKKQVNYCESSGDSEGSKAGACRDKVKLRRRLDSSESEGQTDFSWTRLKRRADSSEEESRQRRRRLSLKRRRASEEDDDDDDDDSDQSSEGERPVRKRVNRIDSDDSDDEEKEKKEIKEEEEGGVLGKGASPLDYSLVELHPPTNGQSPIKALESLAHIGPQKLGATAVAIAPNGLEVVPQDDDEDDLLGVTDLVDFVCNSDVL
uniref:PHD-type domain-containing protein n=1 Tax=Esox lucius TaxID=8010 RepID=A0A3P8YN35_ESOLU